MRKEKQLLLDQIKSYIEQSQSLIVTKYDKIGPALSWDFRCNLKKTGGDFEVVKKRVFAKALEEAGLEISKDALEGHIALVFSEDDGIEMTKTTFDFAKDHQGFLDVVCGFYEKTFYTKDQVKALSKLPSKDEMRAQILGLFEAPMVQTLSVMESLLTSVLHCLENKSQKEEK